MKAFNFLHIQPGLSVGIQVRISLLNLSTREPIKFPHQKSTTSSRCMTCHRLQPFIRDILRPLQPSRHYHCHIQGTNNQCHIHTIRTHIRRTTTSISTKHLTFNNHHKTSRHNLHRTWTHLCTPTLTGTSSQ